MLSKIPDRKFPRAGLHHPRGGGGGGQVNKKCFRKFLTANSSARDCTTLGGEGQVNKKYFQKFLPQAPGGGLSPKDVNPLGVRSYLGRPFTATSLQFYGIILNLYGCNMKYEISVLIFFNASTLRYTREAPKKRISAPSRFESIFV